MIAVRYRVAESTGLALAHAGITANYALRGVQASPDTNVVARLDQIGPVWSVAFGITTIALVVALISGIGRVPVHALATGVTCGFTFALVFSAAVAPATTGWAAASLGVGLTIAAAALTASYRHDQGVIVWTRRP